MEWEYAMYFVIRLQCNHFLLLLLLFRLKSSSTPRCSIIKIKFLVGHYWEN